VRKLITLVICLTIIVGGSVLLYKKVERQREIDAYRAYKNAQYNRDHDYLTEKINRLLPNGLRQDVLRKMPPKK